MAKRPGKFVVSLDFELMWGVRDVVGPETYGEHIRGVHQALPKILQYFKAYNISGTFAAVGFLFFDNKQQLLAGLPQQVPGYKDANLSPYGNYINHQVGQDIHSDPYHYGAHLIDIIKSTPGQEIGTHTFSHFYCLEEGQDKSEFIHDLQAAIKAASKRDIDLKSIIFPRNQVNEAYLPVCLENGITCYRSNENSWVYKARNGQEEHLLRRAIRLLDAYVNLTGHHCHTIIQTERHPVNIPSSRFLRPYSHRLRFLENLRLRRIKKSMTYAAVNGLTYHLWWHPHNFGINFEQNFSFLEKILQHYQYLQQQYQFSSVTMSQLAAEVSSGQ